MKLVSIKVRKKWQIFNSLYKISKKNIVEGISSNYYSEDALYIRSSIGLFIDVGWYITFNKNASKIILAGRIYQDFDLDDYLEKKEFESVLEAVVWVKKWIKKIEKIEDNMTKEEKKKKMEELKRKFEEINR